MDAQVAVELSSAGKRTVRESNYKIPRGKSLLRYRSPPSNWLHRHDRGGVAVPCWDVAEALPSTKEQLCYCALKHCDSVRGWLAPQIAARC